MCLKATPSRKVLQTPAPATSKWGQNGEERAALLRVRIDPKGLRAVGGSFFLNCGIAREKTNWPEHTASGTEKLQRRASPSLLEVGGSGEGKGANSATEKPPTPSQQTGPRFLSKDFRRPNQRRPLGPAAEGKGGPHLGRGRPSLWLPEPIATEGKGAPHPGRVHPSLWLPEPLRPGKAKNPGATESTLLWSARKLDLHSTQGPLHIEQPGA